ncbi:MAG TPA: dTDP-4-dehydrorhamnose reductase [Solirubrobacteraceae bacterium]|nr:dTDP-4-dehydrorhamnose reductase [Solirubrobacteraceae bacterium]
MRFLVTGSAGMLGRDVVAAAGRAGHDVVALTRRDLDITEPRAVARTVLDVRPAAVVNCAAWTDVDGAEAREAEATAINGAGAGAVARAAAEAGALIVHVSSDYVFAGTGDRPYVESSPVGPLSAYGRSKLAGERAVAEASPRHAIVRSSWLFGPGGRNFVDTMLALAAERDEVTVVDDQVGSPTYTGHLAAALVAVAERGLTGVLHVAGGGECSWHDLAAAAFAATGAEVRLQRGRTADLGRPAPRPAYSVLRSERDEAPRLPDWREGLAAHLAASREAVA